MLPLETGFLGLVAVIVLIFVGIPIGVSMAVVGFAGFALISGIGPAIGLVRNVPYSTASQYALSVVPFFILMGEFSFHSGISRDLYIAAHKWIGQLPGGLAMSTIWAGAGFGALCGSGAASTATFGTVAMPEMRKFGYNWGFAASTISAAGTLAIMIPPSTPMIVYGAITGTSIGKLFIAGIIPGLTLTVMYCITIWFLAGRNKTLAPPSAPATCGERIAALSSAWAMIVLFAAIMGGIWLGVFTPTEGGAVGAFGSLLFMIYRRMFNRKTVIAALTATAKLTGMMFMVLIGATMFSTFLAVSGAPQAIGEWLGNLPIPPIGIIFGIVVLYFFLGWVMEELSMVIMTTPILFPVVQHLGFDPVWYGIMVVIAVQQGQITPPVGVNLNIIQSMAHDVPTMEIYKWMMPYVVTLAVFMLIMLFVPDIALVLPQMMK